MSYRKFTIIAGYDTDEINPFSIQALGRPLIGEEFDACREWYKAHHKSTVRRGHITLQTAWRYAQRRNLKQVTMTHHVSDMSGHGRGSRVKYTLSPDGAF